MLVSHEVVHAFGNLIGIETPYPLAVVTVLLLFPPYEYLMLCLIWRAAAAMCGGITVAWYGVYTLSKMKLRSESESTAEAIPSIHRMNHPRNSMIIFKVPYLCAQLIIDIFGNFMDALQLVALLLGSFLLWFAAGYRGPLAEHLLALFLLLILGSYAFLMLQGGGRGYTDAM